MNFELKKKRTWHHFGVITAMVLCALLGSCSTTKYVPVVECHTDTLLLSRNIRDSIYLHDSIRVSEKGDTIRIEKWHTRYVERTSHDTIYQARHDSVPAPFPVEKKVPAELTWWQQARLHLANIVLYLLAVVAIIYVGKRHIRRMTRK